MKPELRELPISQRVQLVEVFWSIKLDTLIC